jgi:hypothetical protein
MHRKVKIVHAAFFTNMTPQICTVYLHAQARTKNPTIDNLAREFESGEDSDLRGISWNGSNLEVAFGNKSFEMQLKRSGHKIDPRSVQFCLTS